MFINILKTMDIKIIKDILDDPAVQDVLKKSKIDYTKFKFDSQETDSWRYLQREMSAEFGAGQIVATPNSYWKFINQVVLKQTIRIIRVLLKILQHNILASISIAINAKMATGVIHSDVFTNHTTA